MDANQLGSLERLSKLRESGHLSHSEFEEQKRRIIEPSAANVGPKRVGGLIVWLLLVAAIGIAAVGALFLMQSSENIVDQKASIAPKVVAKATPAPVTPTVALAKPPEPPSAAAAWLGEYDGSFDGATGSMSVVSRSPEKVDIDLGIGAERCVGGINFKNVRVTGDTLRLMKPRDDSGFECKLTLAKAGNRVRITENGCSNYHGFECTFDGSVRRKR